MKIETKYNVGDIVWMMRGQGVSAKTSEGKIMSVKFVKDNGFQRKGNITYDFAKKNDIGSFDEERPDSCNEIYLFATKEALLASL